jgi:hypothetical protein
MEASSAPSAANNAVGAVAQGAPLPPAASSRPSGGVDTTRVLALFGYVGPVASLMTHTLFPHAGGAGAAGGPRSIHIQKMGGVGAAPGGDGRLQMRPSTGLTPGKTRFVLSATEDAIDSVLPCAAERMFRRPGRFANANNMRFNYSQS